MPLASAVGTGMTVLFAVVLAAGYIVLWVIWRKFFRGSYRHDDEHGGHGGGGG